jgi:hypothetical protein
MAANMNMTAFWDIALMMEAVCTSGTSRLHITISQKAVNNI